MSMSFILYYVMKTKNRLDGEDFFGLFFKYGGYIHRNIEVLELSLMPKPWIDFVFFQYYAYNYAYYTN